MNQIDLRSYLLRWSILMKNNFSVAVSLWTLTVKEVRRFLRIWVQTLVPPAVTMSLYFVIFGSLIGPRIGSMDGFDYIQYMIPGLIMLSVITNSYNNVVSSFYSVKFQKSIEELLISPMPNWTILLGFVLGGVCRGCLLYTSPSPRDVEESRMPSSA